MFHFYPYGGGNRGGGIARFHVMREKQRGYGSNARANSQVDAGEQHSLYDGIHDADEFVELAAAASFHPDHGGPGNRGELPGGPPQYAHHGDGAHTRNRHSESAWLFPFRRRSNAAG